MTETRTVALRELEHDPVAIAGNEQRLDKLDDLLASIPAHGLNQSLRVRPWAGDVPKAKGKGKKAAAEAAPAYGVIAGNRRLASLRRLRDTGGQILGVAVTDDWPVPVIIGEADDADAFEITSAENVQRLALTPVEEFRAFQKMADKASPKEIAAQFGVPEKRVQQRLKLAALHTDVLAALEVGKISMEAAQAFTVEPDPQRQAAYLKKAKSWELSPGSIRQAFTDELIRSDSAIAKLVGNEAYVAAGGQVLADSFGDVAYWINPEIVDQLLDSRMAEQKAAWIEEGWLFAESLDEFGKDSRHGAGAIYYAETLRPEPAGLASELDDLGERREEIVAGGAAAFTAEQKAMSGVVYDPTGRRAPAFGLLRLTPDATPSTAAAPKPAASLDAPGDARVNELSTAMSVVLRERVAREPDMALRLIIAALHAKAWLDHGIPLKLLGDVSKPEGESPVAAATGDNRFAHALAWAMTQDVPTLLVYLAALVGPNVGVVRFGGSYAEGERALIDFVDPAVLHKFKAEAYFGGISKPLITLAWDEMYSDLLRRRGQAALAGEAFDIPSFNSAGKKGDMVAAAVIAAQLTGWLPPQLRTPSYVGPGGDEVEPLREAAE